MTPLRPCRAGVPAWLIAMHFLRPPMRTLVLGGIFAAFFAQLPPISTAKAAAQHAPLHSSHATPPAGSDPSGYIDSAICAECHQNIAQSYNATGMGRSFSLPDAAGLRSEFNGASVDNQPSGMHYVLLERDGKLLERRYQIGYRGEQTNIVDKQVDYVIGSGNHAQTFLHRNAQGKLIELPVTWYAERGGYWAMSPGYDRADQEDFRRAIPAECMFCHNAYPRPLSGFNPAGLNPPAFPKTLPEGIDCQRCHGPGRAHAEAARSGASVDVIRAAIVNPARLNRDRQLEVCMQCHLETSSSHMPNEIRRYNRAVFSYRPGQPLGDYEIFFDPISNRKDDRFEIAHAAYRLRMSACFRNSQMTCITCHDPHTSYRAPGMAQHYLAVCQSCHQDVKHTVALPASENCLTCHMPQRRADDAVHVVMTDHYIQRIKLDRDLVAPKPEMIDEQGRLGIVLYYPPQLPPTAENELYLDLAKVQDGSRGAPAIAHLEEDLLKDSPAASEFYFELAHAYSKVGRDADAVRWYEEALRRRPVYPAASKELAIALVAADKMPRAEEILSRAAAASPDDGQLLADLGNLYQRQERVADARRALSRALALDPSQAQTENLLGLLAIREKDRQDAEKWLRAAIRDNPDLAEAHSNLGNLLSGAGDYEQAAYQFQRAIRVDSKYAAAHHGYGLMLELMHSYDQAIDELEQAARLDPGDAQTHGDLGDLLAARGQLPEAEAQYGMALASEPGAADLHTSLGEVLAAEGKQAEAGRQFAKAVAINPTVYEAQLGLATVLAREGQTAEARLHCQKAAESPDPSLRGAALNLLHQLGN